MKRTEDKRVRQEKERRQGVCVVYECVRVVFFWGGASFKWAEWLLAWRAAGLNHCHSRHVPCASPLPDTEKNMSARVRVCDVCVGRGGGVYVRKKKKKRKCHLRVHNSRSTRMYRRPSTSLRCGHARTHIIRSSCTRAHLCGGSRDMEPVNAERFVLFSIFFVSLLLFVLSEQRRSLTSLKSQQQTQEQQPRHGPDQ